MFTSPKLKFFYRRYHVWLYALTLVGTFILFWLLSGLRIDADFGWHLSSGQYILAHWIPSTDIYTYTAPQFPWINHEWLNDVIVAKLFVVGGYQLVATFFALVWTAGIALAARKKYVLAAWLGAISLTPFVGIRPVAWSVLMFALLERCINAKNRSLIWFLPVIMLVWANLHGSFALGLVILVGWQIFSSRKIPWTCLALSFLVTFINPYGWNVYIEIARTIFDNNLRSHILEWHYFFLPWPSVFYVVALGILHMTLSKKPFRQLLSLPGLMLALSLSSIRHFPLFEASSLRYVEQYEEGLTKRLTKQRYSKGRQAIILTILGIFLVIASWSIWIEFAEAKANAANYPHKAVAYLKSNRCTGNLFNSYDFGGYLIWHLPEQKVYIDGRMPSWQENGRYYFQNFLDFMNNAEFRSNQIEQYNIGCILVKNDELTGKAKDTFLSDLYSKGWHKVDQASDDRSMLLVRQSYGY